MLPWMTNPYHVAIKADQVGCYGQPSIIMLPQVTDECQKRVRSVSRCHELWGLIKFTWLTHNTHNDPAFTLRNGHLKVTRVSYAVQPSMQEMAEWVGCWACYHLGGVCGGHKNNSNTPARQK